ncbi:hypothetical protein [Pseudoroseicyclus tamaricis]|uniref:UrcA family protein n=1 Tax=Pseudoroseicyclus tamaricis TaxID=2705421 RepID=A0A6B2JHN7_9RHOB|nr:hypothetical protein [Pseudoroseicyclus tamaricis]NDV00783.1 hypothetical protein [Pseudoroseicyclus tamaricis]
MTREMFFFTALISGSVALAGTTARAEPCTFADPAHIDGHSPGQQPVAETPRTTGVKARLTFRDVAHIDGHSDMAEARAACAALGPEARAWCTVALGKGS